MDIETPISTRPFDVNCGDSIEKYNIEVTYNEEYGDLPEPSRTGFTFDGWFTNTTYTNEVTSESTVLITNDHSLYAKWIADGYLLTFIFNNGTKAEERPLNYNDLIEYPDFVEKEGHMFIGWDSDIEHMPSHDLTIMAQWSINEYEVTFDFKNGMTAKETVKYDEPINYPEEIVRERATSSTGGSPSPGRCPPMTLLPRRSGARRSCLWRSALGLRT